MGDPGEIDPTAVEILPALSLAGTVLFPGMGGTVLVSTARCLGAIREASRSPAARLAVFAEREEGDPDPDFAALFDVGTMARVLDIRTRSCCRRWVAGLESVGRIRLLEPMCERPFRMARVQVIRDQPEPADAIDALAAALRETVLLQRKVFPRCERTCRAAARLREATDPGDLPGAIGDLLVHLSIRERQGLLELPSLTERLDAMRRYLERRLTIPGPSHGRRTLLH